MERWVCKQCCDSHRAGSCSWQGEEGHDALPSGRILAHGWQRAAKQEVGVGSGGDAAWLYGRLGARPLS